MKFTEFSLHEDLQKSIEDAGYITCTDVQSQVLQHAFGGHDLYVQSQTGTGKTAAYLTVILQRLASEPELVGRQALIMVPTRELAVQVEEEARKLAKYLHFKVGSFYGGVGYAHQQQMLRDKVEILVGTPGRVLDLNASGQMNLMNIAFLVLDEADRMFDMGFYPDLRKLIRVVPPAEKRQTMLFSATLNAYIKNLAWEYTKEPLEIEIEPEHVDVVEIEQLLYHVSSPDKFKLLLGIFQREKPESAIVFCNTKRYTEIVAKRLRMNGIECEFIMGDLPQIKRLKIIEDVKSGKNAVLVATDVAARGLDVEDLSLVVNYDLPNETENYIHRIGRTGRAGKSGKAITLASEQDVYILPSIEKYLGKKIPSEVAIEELFAEDKSEGLRIHTDDYGQGRDGGRRDSGRRDDTRRDSSRRDGGRRDGTRRDGGRREPPRLAPHTRNAEMRDDTRRDASGPARPARDAGRQDGDRRNDGRRNDTRRNDVRRREGRRPEDSSRQNAGTPVRRGAPAVKADTQHLASASFDERMAVYKEKYGKRSADSRASDTRNANTSSNTDTRSNKNAKNGGNRQRRAPQQDVRTRKGTPESKPPRSTPKGAKGSTANSGKTAAKTSLFSRIKNIFSRKDK